MRESYTVLDTYAIDINELRSRLRVNDDRGFQTRIKSAEGLTVCAVKWRVYAEGALILLAQTVARNFRRKTWI